MSDESPRVIFIPDNYHTGTSMFGVEIKISNAIQTIILVLIPIILNYFVIPSYFSIDRTSTVLLSFTIFCVVILGYLGLVGVNGMTLGEFVYIYLMYRKSKRKTYYNPRLKKELKPIIVEETTREELPRDKMLALYNQYKEKFDEKNRQAALESEMSGDYENSQIFFEDDYGIVDTPVEYMSQKEYKAYQKRLKKERKEAIKKAKAEAKKQRKIDKQNQKVAKKNSKNNKKKGKKTNENESEIVELFDIDSAINGEKGE